MLSCRLRSRVAHFCSKQYQHAQFSLFSATATNDIVSDVTIIGGGLAGLASIQRLRSDGFTVNAIESGDGVGGTWYWNRYPGAVCDVASMDYSLTFHPQLDYNWTQKYSTQSEILSYVNHVADKNDLRKHINFKQTVQKCTFSESDLNWTIETDTGHKYISKMLILATGVLSVPNEPQYDGLDQYNGHLYYTSRYPDNPVDFSDKKVAIIGTGSTGIQCIPAVAPTAKHLTVYQRTAQYVCPLNNEELSESEQQKIKDNYAEFVEELKTTKMATHLTVCDKSFDEMTPEEYENEIIHRWDKVGGLSFLFTCADQITNINADLAITKFIRNKIHGIVRDPKVASLLCPTDDLLYACKRPLFDSGCGYFETYNRDNVELVSISPTRDNSTPIKSITSSGIITSDGIERECDVLIFATGFDALSGAVLKMDIRGLNNETIQNSWKDHPRTYLGLQTVGFPNMFMINGPHSPSVFTNMLPSIEQHVNLIADLIGYMKNNDLNCVQPTIQAQDDWTKGNDDLAKTTLFSSSTCNSWYWGANIDGKKRHFLPSFMGFDKYGEKCKEIQKENYIGFDFDLQKEKIFQ